MKLSLLTLFQKLVRRVLAQTYDCLDCMAISQPGRVNSINCSSKKNRDGRRNFCRRTDAQKMGRSAFGGLAVKNGLWAPRETGRRGICSHQRWCGGAGGKEATFRAGDTGDAGSIPGSGGCPLGSRIFCVNGFSHSRAQTALITDLRS